MAKLVTRYVVNFNNGEGKASANFHTVADARAFAENQAMAVIYDRVRKIVVGEHGTRPKQNPRPRIGTAKPMRKSSATGKKPSARLVARRRANRIPGVYPNPAKREQWFSYSFSPRDQSKVVFLLNSKTDLAEREGTYWRQSGFFIDDNDGERYHYPEISQWRYGRIKKNPDIHIDIDSHNASRSRKVRTNPARKAAKMRYTVQTEFGSQWRDIAQCNDLPTAKSIARNYAKTHFGAVRVITGVTA